jgi:hypothetical protein
MHCRRAHYDQSSQIISRDSKDPTKIVDVFEPEKGTTFVELKIRGTACGVLEGTEAVKGSIAAEVIPTGVEHTEGLLHFPAIAITPVTHEGVGKTVGLKLGATNLDCAFIGAYGSRLETGESFGAFET